ncbi:unnamed protein product [Rotaria socialis]|uniref:Uncharacterized protein n=1 Tax=Rotaria socialis TaxID=392032 RepID=A0A818YY10_9BILA|nr:unnamed protein product [Rotaria socialis]CAF3757205.1 unnamed protein product [Rotaria socialis]
METAGKYSNPQSLWRWDDVTNTLVHDRAVTAEKADINAETSSEKIDLWNLSPARRPMAYEKYPLEISKNKTTIAIEDIVHISLNMVSDTYYVPEKFAEFVKQSELEDFFLHLINYFHWYFEYKESQVMTNPLCVQFNHEETTRISNAECHMNTALVFVAQKYSNVVLGTGLKQYHHFYWIEGNDGDPLTKKREIIPYSGRVSRTLIDRGNAELLIIFATFVVWITFERKYFEVIREEIGRIIRTDAFPNPTYSTIQIRTRSSRSSRSTTSDFTTGGNGENASTYSDRKNTAASKKSTRSQKTVATASTTMSHTSSTSSKSGTKRQPFQRLLTQRSPIVVTLLPTARDQSAWLFDRVRGKSDQAAKLPKLLPENKFKIRYEIGVLGQPIDTLTLIASGKTPTGNTSASQLAQNDVKRRHSTVDSGI